MTFAEERAAWWAEQQRVCASLGMADLAQKCADWCDGWRVYGAQHLDWDRQEDETTWTS
jgi:hypothetical protein